MALVVFFLVFVFAIAGDDLHRRWRRSRLVNPPPLPRRLPAARLYKVLLAHLIVAAVLVVTFRMGGWTLDSVGFQTSASGLEAILAGELAFLALVLGYGLALRALGRFAAMRSAANRGNLRAWPRGRKDFGDVLPFLVLRHNLRRARKEQSRKFQAAK